MKTDNLSYMAPAPYPKWVDVWNPSYPKKDQLQGLVISELVVAAWNRALIEVDAHEHPLVLWDMIEASPESDYYW